MFKKKITLAVGLALACAQSMAAVLPYGVQVNVSKATVANHWGWTECYSGSSWANDNIASLLSDCRGDSLMLAASKVGSDSYGILAAAGRNDVLFDTGIQTGYGNDVTHVANGAQWYFSDNWSWGFSELGNAVELSSCDVDLYAPYAGEGNKNPKGNTGMCWHTNSGSLNPGWGMNLGGQFIGLGNTWNRVVLSANVIEASAVPEPATPALFGVALAALALLRRRRQPGK